MADLDVVTQSDKIHTKISEVYKDIKAGLGSSAPTGTGIFPDFPTFNLPAFNEEFDYSELNRFANNMVKESANYAAGSATETSHLAASVLRELDMMGLSKFEHYSIAYQEADVDQQYYDSRLYFNKGLLQGISVKGTLA